MKFFTQLIFIGTLPEAYLPFKPIIDDLNKIAKLFNIVSINIKY
jgi:hypothetical protein